MLAEFAQRCKELLEGGIWLLFNKPQYNVLCSSNLDVLPPRGFGAVLPVWRQCCHHLTAVLTAIQPCS